MIGSLEMKTMDMAETFYTAVRILSDVKMHIKRQSLTNVLSWKEKK